MWCRDQDWPFSLVVITLDYRSRGTWFDPRSGHSTGIFSLQVYFSSYYIWCLVPGWLPSEPKGDAMATESQKSLGIVENIWYKCFIVGWRSCSSAAKRSTNNQYVCKYIGCINDQSNWSGPFSLVVMTLDYRSRGTWFDPRSGHSTEIFSLHVYFSSYYSCKSVSWC